MKSGGHLPSPLTASACVGQVRCAVSFDLLPASARATRGRSLERLAAILQRGRLSYLDTGGRPAPRRSIKPFFHESVVSLKSLRKADIAAGKPSG